MNRARLVERLAAAIEQRGRPRLLLCAVVLVAGLAALAFTTGYAAFVVLLRLWARGHMTMENVVDGLDFDLFGNLRLDSLDSRSSAPVGLRGGASGEGEAVESWSASPSRPLPSSSSRKSAGFSLDFDEDGALFVLLAVAVFSAVLAVGFVIYAAPVLLAEVLVDAVVVSAVYQRVAYTPPQHWARTIFRRTWLPALIVLISLTAAGYALQRLVPGAPSIGPALRGLAAR
jgi:hypothetical protein